LILSKDINKLNLTLNLAAEFPLREGQPEFIPALGMSYPITKILRAGSEIKYEVQSHQGTVIPQIFLTFPHNITAKLGFAHGFSDNQEDYGRLAVEIEL
jgi:hypothetical protein